MRVKICGITKPEQGQAIAQLGATALGFICVTKSARYVSIPQLSAIVAQLPNFIERIGVFANASPEIIVQTANNAALTGIQLHGDESPQFCLNLRQLLPNVELIKALRIKNSTSLATASNYLQVVDTLLLDAYHPHLLGGTGETISWDILAKFNPKQPWLLAGGLTPDNVLLALEQVQPSGIDLSSGVEKSPGDKDLEKVALLFKRLRSAAVI